MGTPLDSKTSIDTPPANEHSFTRPTIDIGSIQCTVHVYIDLAFEMVHNDAIKTLHLLKMVQ